MMSTTITPARSSNRPYPYVKRRLVPSLLRAKAIHSGIAVAASPKLWMVSERRAIEPESTTTMICTRAVAKRATNDHFTAHMPRSEVAMGIYRAVGVPVSPVVVIMVSMLVCQANDSTDDLALCTLVRGRGILRTSPFGDSANFAN